MSRRIFRLETPRGWYKVGAEVHTSSGLCRITTIKQLVEGNGNPWQYEVLVRPMPSPNELVWLMIPASEVIFVEFFVEFFTGIAHGS